MQPSGKPVANVTLRSRTDAVEGEKGVSDEEGQRIPKNIGPFEWRRNSSTIDPGECSHERHRNIAQSPS
eukprot:7393593-Prorocentrum_lima.AAC.1